MKFIGVEAKDFVLSLSEPNERSLKMAKAFDVNAVELNKGELKVIDVDRTSGVGKFKFDDKILLVQKKALLKTINIVDISDGNVDKDIRIVFTKNKQSGSLVLDDIWAKTKDITKSDAVLIVKDLVMVLNGERGNVDINSVGIINSPSKFFMKRSVIPKDYGLEYGFNIGGSKDRRLQGISRDGFLGEAMVDCVTSNIKDGRVQVCRGVKLKGKDNKFNAEMFTRVIRRKYISKPVFGKNKRPVGWKSVVSNEQIVDIPEKNIEITDNNIHNQKDMLFGEFKNIVNSGMCSGKFFVRVEKKFWKDFVDDALKHYKKDSKEEVRKYLINKFNNGLDRNIMNYGNYDSTMVLTIMDILHDKKIFSNSMHNRGLRKRIKEYMSMTIYDEDRDYVVL